MYAGLALGIYGFTQALFQIPYGMASDRLGRKPVIAFGLMVFMLGSIIAAMSDTLIWLIIGRALQGAGASFIRRISVNRGPYSCPTTH